MFRDTKEALERLNAALTEEETEPQEAPAAEDAEHTRRFRLDEVEDTPRYRAYNADRTEEDPEDLSEKVLAPQKRGATTVLAVLTVLLTVGLLVLGWLYLKQRGLLP